MCMYIYMSVFVAIDEGCSSKLALSKGGSRGNIESFVTVITYR